MNLLPVATWIISLLFIVVVTAVGYLVYSTQRIARRAEAAVPATGKFIDVDGNRIHYVEEGQGRPILFVHGLGGQLHHLRHPLFGQFGDGYHLVSIDRPGAGYSSRASGATGRLTEQAALIARLIVQLDLEKPLVVGHSLGGMITLTLALNHPEAISGIVLLSPLTKYRADIPPEMAPIYITSPLKRWIMANTVAIPAALKYAPQTLAYVFGPQQPPKDYMTKGGGWLGLRPSHFYAMVTDLVAVNEDMPSLQQRYGEIDMPAGMLFGSADMVLDYETNGLAMRDRITGLDLEIVDGIGHHPQYAVTDRVVALIRRVADRAFGA